MTFAKAHMLALLSLSFLFAGCRHDPYSHLYADLSQAEYQETLLIEPGKAVGKVRGNMTIEEVIAELGRPDRRYNETTLQYLRFGFSVVADREGLTRVVLCGDPSDKSSALIKLFSGRTKEGIGMGSSRDDLIAAYGPPSAVEPWGEDEEQIVYSSMGIGFILADDKVHHITVSFPKRG
jgi:hypothetical protein